MADHRGRYVVGVLGGMGPVASAAFLRTVYNMNRGKLEQATPNVVLISNPTVKDRTAAFLSGDHDPEVLERGIEQLLECGASEVVVCCFTMHYVLPHTRPALRSRVISLVDTALSDMARTPGRLLLACSTGSRRLGVFESHPLWPAVADRIVQPDETEQSLLHEVIYHVKRDHQTEPLMDALACIAIRHEVQSIVAGCTELHLLSPAFAGESAFNQRFSLIDPLVTMAERITERTHAEVLRA